MPSGTTHKDMSPQLHRLLAQQLVTSKFTCSVFSSIMCENIKDTYFVDLLWALKILTLIRHGDLYLYSQHLGNWGRRIAMSSRLAWAKCLNKTKTKQRLKTQIKWLICTKHLESLTGTLCHTSIIILVVLFLLLLFLFFWDSVAPNALSLVWCLCLQRAGVTAVHHRTQRLSF